MSINKWTTLIVTALLITPLTSTVYANCGACQASHKEADHKHAEAHQHNIVETASEAGKFNTLLAAAEAAGLVETLNGEGPYTVFAPTDAAFGKLPEGTVESLLQPENKELLKKILLYHVVPGKMDAKHVAKAGLLKTADKGKFLAVSVKDSDALVDNAKIIKTDIYASNGIIHVIDTVVMPNDKPNIVQVASKAGSFKTLLAAAKAAGLAETLSYDGPFTVFAPTDDAFAKLPSGTLDSLLLPENRKKLQAILLYHVVPGVKDSANVVKKKSLKTAAGMPAEIMMMNKKPYIGDAMIIKTDIEAGNGIIHVIDTVMIPEEKHAATH